MFRVRKHLLDTFREEALTDFEDRMITHLRVFSSAHFKILREEEIRGVIQSGMERAAPHGLTSGRSIRYFVDTMFLVGSGFDEDPMLPWARAALTDTFHTHQEERVNLLFSRAREHVAAIRPELVALAQGGGAGFMDDLRRLRAEDNEPLVPAGFAATGPVQKRAFDWLVRRFPMKSERAGEARVRALVELAADTAVRRGLGTPRGVLVLSAMMFVLGAGCAADPLLPWLSDILDDPSVPTPGERVDRVFGTAVNTLRKWWG